MTDMAVDYTVGDIQYPTVEYFLLAQLAADEWWALEATRTPGRAAKSAPSTGAHWLWVCDDDDAVIPVRPPVGPDDILAHGYGCIRLSLRSREEYPTDSVGELPSFLISADEVLASAAGHITLNDPASVLARVKAQRKIVEAAREYSPELEHGDNGKGAFDFVIRQLAQQYAERPGYQAEEWAP